MRIHLLSILVSYSLLSLKVGQAVAQPSFQTDSLLTARIFPILDWMKNDPLVHKLILKDKNLVQVKGQHLRRTSSVSCDKRNCFSWTLKLTTGEITEVTNRLAWLYGKNKKFRKKLNAYKLSGAYPKFSSESDTAFIRLAWLDAASGINRIFDIYVKGEKPRYAAIDSISFSPGDTSLENRLHQLALRLPQQDDKTDLFFDHFLQAALDVLRMNNRHEAVSFEPLHGGMNEDGFKKIRETDFSKYPYAMILVPGLGPEIPGQALAPGGAKRCKAGAERFKKGLAPFIVVSGGNVHPFQTPFNEAVEMKKYLVDSLGIPSHAVFIEPYARHTTTNLRNTNRMIYRFGFPLNKPVLIVTDSSQAAYIAGRMSVTANRDLGYIPFERLNQLSEQEIEYFPVKESLQPDPFDPLDP